MTQTRRRVVVTGAGGRIGRAITPRLPGSWDVQGTDLTASEGISILDITNPDACRAAFSRGVRRFGLASSLQVVCAMSDKTQVRVGDPPRPANLYGATKAWAEALGAWVAGTTPTSVVALRIGYFAPERPDPASVPARELSAWLSPRDAAELVRAAVEAVGFDFVVANGISANRYRRADLTETMQQLGYRPVDDAWSSP